MTKQPQEAAVQLELTSKQLRVLRECVRIASEDGSIETFDSSGEIVSEIIEKLNVPNPLPRGRNRKP